MTKHHVLIVAVAALSACSSQREPHKAAAAEPAPVPVKVVQATDTEWPNTYEAPGTVKARVTTTLSSRVMGYVREVRVNPGDRVSAGQLVVTLDARDLDSSLAQARAAEQEARNGIPEADNGIAGAKAQLELAQTTFRRMEDLFQKKSISHQEFDEARARLQTAEAGYRMALSRRTQLDSKIAQVKQAVESAAVMHSYSELRAPFAGVVTEKRVEPGQMATPGAPLLTIEQSGAFRLEAPVEESLLSEIKLGQNVSVAFDASDRTLSAKVSEIVPAVDPGSRAFLVKATLPNDPILRTGLFGRLRIARGSRHALSIPSAAIIQRGELQSVLAVEGGIARLRMITT